MLLSDPPVLALSIISIVFIILWLYEKLQHRKTLAGQAREEAQIQRLTQTQLKASIDAIPYCFVIADHSGKVLVINQGFSRIFTNQPPPKNINDIHSILGKDYNLKSKFFHSVYSKKLIEDSNVLWEGKYLKIFLSPITDELNNEAIGHLLVISDETKERVLDRAKDEFFSIASHELRTPLTIIKGNASMLLDFQRQSGQNVEQLKIVSDILTASDRLIHIVNDLLQISSLEHHQVEYAFTKFAFKDVVVQAVNNLKEKADEKGVPIIVIENPDVPQVQADRGQTLQVLMNLLDNSLKYTDQGRITVSYSRVLDYLQVSISDTGRGIPQELQSLLFRKFQQAGKSLYARDTVGGVGLGLYISKLLIEQMGGRIKLLTSTPGIGSTFSFTLPIVQ